jgi:hypothetical protein
MSEVLDLTDFENIGCFRDDWEIERCDRTCAYFAAERSKRMSRTQRIYGILRMAIWATKCREYRGIRTFCSEIQSEMRNGRLNGGGAVIRTADSHFERVQACPERKRSRSFRIERVSTQPRAQRSPLGRLCRTGIDDRSFWSLLESLLAADSSFSFDADDPFWRF